MMDYSSLGYEAWVSRDYGGEGKAVTLTEVRLGEFFFWLFRHGGHVYSDWAMSKEVGSYIQLGVCLPKGMKEKFEEDSGFKLEPPPKLKLA